MRQDLERRNNPEELGRRLASARRSRNLSQDEVAKHLEVSRPTLVAIEKGTRPVKPTELEALAQLYGRSVHQLVSGREFVADFAPQFRFTQFEEIPEAAVSEAVNVFKELCENYLSLETLLNAPMPRFPHLEPYALGHLTPQLAAEEIATLERSRLNLGQGPIPDPLKLMESDMGLRVFVVPLEEFRIAGMFVYTDRLGGCILVNGKHPQTRQNWTIGHEFAHFLTDRYREEITILLEYERKPRPEQVADYFAAAFLMPAAGLRQRFQRVVQSRGDFTVADLCMLADQYNVSVEAMTHRLESLGSLPKGAWVKLSAQGFAAHKVKDHLGIKTPNAHQLRLPYRYRRLAVHAFEDEKIGESELMKILRCSRVEARETVEELTQSLEMTPAGESYQLELDFGEVISQSSAEKV